MKIFLYLSFVCSNKTMWNAYDFHLFKNRFTKNIKQHNYKVLLKIKKDMIQHLEKYERTFYEIVWTRHDSSNLMTLQNSIYMYIVHVLIKVLQSWHTCHSGQLQKRFKIFMELLCKNFVKNERKWIHLLYLYDWSMLSQFWGDRISLFASVITCE